MRRKGRGQSALSVKTMTSGWTVIKEISTTSSPSQIFKALTTAGQLNKWFTTEAQVDPRVGGKYSNRDGDKGKFLEVIPNERIRFTWENPGWAPGSIVEIQLKRLRDKTVLTLIHSGFKKEAEEKHYASNRSGWDWALTNLKAHVEGRRVIGYEDWLKKRKR